MGHRYKTLPRGRRTGWHLRRTRHFPLASPQLPNVEGEAMNAERDTKDGPFCWQSKAALWRIRDSLGDDLSAACRTRSVYLALCEIASDNGAAQFIVPKGLLAFRAGLSPRTVQRVFPDLERAGVLTVERNATGLKASSREVTTSEEDLLYLYTQVVEEQKKHELLTREFMAHLAILSQQ